VLAEMRGDADEMPLLMVEGTPERILALLSPRTNPSPVIVSDD
jgi:hypothetical protein